MATKKSTKKAVAKRTVAKKSAKKSAKKAVAKKAVAKKSTKKAVAKQAVAKQAVAKQAVAKQAVAKQAVAKQAVAKQAVAKQEVAKQAVVKQEVAKQTVAPSVAAAVATPVVRDALHGGPAVCEAAFGRLTTWIVDELAEADDARARAVIAAAISSFYDVRQALGEPRQEYAGHFFMVDGVGFEVWHPVAWKALRARVGAPRVEALSALFLEIEPTVA